METGFSQIEELELEGHQLNVKNVFLNEKLKEETYVAQPKLAKSKACKIKRSLYGLGISELIDDFLQTISREEKPTTTSMLRWKRNGLLLFSYMQMMLE